MIEGDKRIGFFPACGLVDPKSPDRLSAGTRAQVEAAGNLFTAGAIDKIVFTAGDISRGGIRGLSRRVTLVGDRMVSLLYRTFPGVPVSDSGRYVEHSTAARNTQEEVRDFRELAGNRGWGDILVVRTEDFGEEVDRAIALAFRPQALSDIQVLSRDRAAVPAISFARTQDFIGSKSPAVTAEVLERVAPVLVEASR